MAKLGTLNDLRKRDFWRIFDGNQIEKLARTLPSLVFQQPANYFPAQNSVFRRIESPESYSKNNEKPGGRPPGNGSA